MSRSTDQVWDYFSHRYIILISNYEIVGNRIPDPDPCAGGSYLGQASIEGKKKKHSSPALSLSRVVQIQGHE